MDHLEMTNDTSLKFQKWVLLHEEGGLIDTENSENMLLMQSLFLVVIYTDPDKQVIPAPFRNILETLRCR